VRKAPEPLIDGVVGARPDPVLVGFGQLPAEGAEGQRDDRPTGTLAAGLAAEGVAGPGFDLRPAIGPLDHQLAA